MRYLWEFYPNLAMAGFHHTLEGLPRLDRYRESNDPRAAELRERLESIPGVIGASSHDPYKITIERGLAFEWGPIRDAVLANVLEFARYTGDDPEELPEITAVVAR